MTESSAGRAVAGGRGAGRGSAGARCGGHVEATGDAEPGLAALPGVGEGGLALVAEPTVSRFARQRDQREATVGASASRSARVTVTEAAPIAC